MSIQTKSQAEMKQKEKFKRVSKFEEGYENIYSENEYYLSIILFIALAGLSLGFDLNNWMFYLSILGVLNIIERIVKILYSLNKKKVYWEKIK